MKRLQHLVLSAAVALTALVGLAGNATAHEHRRHVHDHPRVDHRGDHIDERQQRQAHAIRHASRTGRLTPHETRHLMRQQAQIRHAEQHARADGHVSHRERERLDAMQDHARRSIARQPNDHHTW